MRVVNAIVFFAFVVILNAGCAEQEGPAERAGEKIDNAVREGKNAIEEAADDTADKIEEAGDKLRK